MAERDIELHAPDWVAKKFNLTRRHVRWLTDTGQLPVYRLGHRTLRYSREDVEAFLAKKRKV